MDKGYIVRENGTAYFTSDMGKTVKWFEEVLGWYSKIDGRNHGVQIHVQLLQ